MGFTVYQTVYITHANFALTSGTRRTYFFKAMPRLSRLVAGHLLPRSALDLRQVPVPFVVDEVEVGQTLLLSTSIFPSEYNFVSATYSYFIMHYRRYGVVKYNISLSLLSHRPIHFYIRFSYDASQYPDS